MQLAIKLFLVYAYKHNGYSRNMEMFQAIFYIKFVYLGSSLRGPVEMNLASIHEIAGSIPGPTQWVWDCYELWYRSQTLLGSSVAVAGA